MKPEILLHLIINAGINPAHFHVSVSGLDIVFNNPEYDTAENRAIVSDILANYESLAPAMERSIWLDQEVRPQRNQLLNDIDIIYCNADKWETMTAEKKAEWRVYKQALRDLPDTIDMTNPVWPTMPID